MRTKKIGETPSGADKLEVVNPPYTLIGNTSIPDSFQITLNVAGLKKMLRGLKDDDVFRIEIFSGYKATEFTVIKSNKKKK